MWSTEAPSPRNVARKLTGRPDGTDATLIDVLLRVVVALAALTAACNNDQASVMSPVGQPVYNFRLTKPSANTLPSGTVSRTGPPSRS